MIKEKKDSFGFLYYHFFQKKHKIKQGRDRDDLSLMMKIHKAKKALNKFTSVSGRTNEFYFFLKNIKQPTNRSIEQMSSRNKHQQRPDCS